MYFWKSKIKNYQKFDQIFPLNFWKKQIFETWSWALNEAQNEKKAREISI